MLVQLAVASMALALSAYTLRVQLGVYSLVRVDAQD